jgi:phospholipid-binding lipoprotein MlaA
LGRSLKILNTWEGRDIESFASIILFVVTQTLGSSPVANRSSAGELPFAICDSRLANIATGNPTTFSDAEIEEDDFALFEDEFAEQAVEVADSLEPLNRVMFEVNDKFYFWVAKPVAQAYKGIAPEPVRTGIRNFFHNLAAPARAVNCLLQGKGDDARTELGRFVVNTTVGILGIGDPAKDELGWQPSEEDLGQTLAVHGLGNGFYIVWPLAGPSTLRDSVGMVGDRFMNPVTYVKPWEAHAGIYALRVTNDTSFRIGDYEALKAEALEPYVAIRDAYIQYRNRKIEE